jgi:membrane-associated protease RseP (regulator of RpoE activity)
LGVTLRSTVEGVVITRVYPDSPADRLGLRPGDFLVSVNGEQFRSAEQMAAAISRFGPGERLNLEIGRSLQPGRLERATARLDEWTTVFRQPTIMEPQITRIEPGYGPTYLDERRQLDPRTVMRPDTGAMQQIRELEEDVRALEEEIEFLRRELRDLRSQIRDLHPDEFERRPQEPAPEERPELEADEPDSAEPEEN